jgi:hypothetical protein
LTSRPHNASCTPEPPHPLCDESGYALVELLLVASLLVVVLSAVLLFGEATQRIAPRDQERSHVIQEAQVGLHRMTQELRKAHLVNDRGSYFMDVQVRLGGVDTRVRYECDQPHPVEPAYRRCLRFVNGGAAGELVVDRVLNAADVPPDPVFIYTTDGGGNVAHVQARVELPARGDLKTGHGHRITYADGFYPRNLGV